MYVAVICSPYKNLPTELGKTINLAVTFDMRSTVVN